MKILKRKSGDLPLAIILVTILMTACASPNTEEQTMSSKQRQAVQPFEVAQVPQLIAGNTTFAFDLYQQLNQDAENLVFSPHSLSIGLAMVCASARGETETQMADALHFDLPQAQLHLAFNSLDQSLANREEGTLHLANALWGSQDHAYQDTFLDILTENFGTGIHLVDFCAPDESRQRINR